MLETSLFESQTREKTRKPFTVVVSIAAHVGTVGLLVLVPLLQTQALTLPAVDLSLLIPHIEKPTDIQVSSARPQGRPPSHYGDVGILTSPNLIPSEIGPETGRPIGIDEPNLLPGSGPGRPGPLFPGFGSVENSGSSTAEPLPPPPLSPPPVINTHPIRQGGDVQAAKLIYQVKPAYPALARMARVQGLVVLEAVISRGGFIDSLRVVSGNPLLTPAALEAVRQWRYSPTMLNSEPVAVITTVNVTFTLSQ